MKELEEKIHKMIFSGVKDFSIVSHTPDILTENIIDISKEIMDIAIEFNIFRLKSEIELELKRISGKITEDEFIEIQMAELNKSADTYWNELFDQFIKERYSK